MPDLVFNLTEAFEGDRQMDKNIAALLEMVGVPFTGAGAAGLMLCRDKLLCKELLSLHKIRVPRFFYTYVFIRRRLRRRHRLGHLEMPYRRVFLWG